MKADVTKKQVADAVEVLQKLVTLINNNKTNDGAIIIDDSSNNEFVNGFDEDCFNSNDIETFVNYFETKLGIEFKTPQG